MAFPKSTLHVPFILILFIIALSSEKSVNYDLTTARRLATDADETVLESDVDDPNQSPNIEIVIPNENNNDVVSEYDNDTDDTSVSDTVSVSQISAENGDQNLMESSSTEMEDLYTETSSLSTEVASPSAETTTSTESTLKLSQSIFSSSGNEDSSSFDTEETSFTKFKSSGPTDIENRSTKNKSQFADIASSLTDITSSFTVTTSPPLEATFVYSETSSFKLILYIPVEAANKLVETTFSTTENILSSTEAIPSFTDTTFQPTDAIFSSNEDTLTTDITSSDMTYADITFSNTQDEIVMVDNEQIVSTPEYKELSFTVTTFQQTDAIFSSNEDTWTTDITSSDMTYTDITFSNTQSEIVMVDDEQIVSTPEYKEPSFTETTFQPTDAMFSSNDDTWTTDITSSDMTYTDITFSNTQGKIVMVDDEQIVSTPEYKDTNLTKRFSVTTQRTESVGNGPLIFDCGTGNDSCLKCRSISLYCQFDFQSRSCTLSNITKHISKHDCIHGWFHSSRNFKFLLVALSALFLSVLLSAYIMCKCCCWRRYRYNSVYFADTEIGKKKFLIFGASKTKKQNYLQDLSKLKAKYGVEDSEAGDESILIPVPEN